MTALAVVYVLHFVLFCPALILGERYTIALNSSAASGGGGGASLASRDGAELESLNDKVCDARIHQIG